MKFVQQTHNRLTINLIPLEAWSVGIFLLILGFGIFSTPQQYAIAYGLLLISVLGETAICHFDKTTGQVSLKRWSLWGYKHIRFPIRDITCVDIEAYKHTDEGNTRYTYRVVFVLAGREKPVPLTRTYSSGRRKKTAIATTICTFLNLTPPLTLSLSPLKLGQALLSGKQKRIQAIADYRAAIQQHPGKMENVIYLLLLVWLEGRSNGRDASRMDVIETKANVVKPNQPQPPRSTKPNR
ncbi:hypothetical protein ACN4EK_31075 [Pantanalinema rosaneae CENA516]|uniref:hypothetical protein n=1 Tax=Pantanalinema rosaneae TaxID=1620701 RepID=UPI003D6F7003